MKLKIFLTIAAILGSAAFMHAQVRVDSNKITYTRAATDTPEHKKTFEVNYPVISGAKSMDAGNRMKEAVSYWAVFNTSLEESLTDFTWLDSLDYTVNYNKNNILEVELTMEGSAAYPDFSSRTLVIDTTTGKRVAFADVFSKFENLLVMIDKAQQKEIRTALAEARKESAADEADLNSMFGDRRFKVSSLDEFSVSDKGVTFLFDYAFPHAFKGLEPEGRYFFTWTELKPFVRRDGLLAPFVR